MDTRYSKSRKLIWMFANILSVVVIVSMILLVTENVLAEDALPQSVGLITTITGIDDASFNASAYQGLLNAANNLGVGITVYEPLDQSEYENLMQQCANENELCIVVGFEFRFILPPIARNNPDTTWGIIDWSYPDCWEGAIEGVDCGSFTELPNVRGLSFNEKQAGYLAGVLAGGMTSSNTIGVVGGMEIPPVVAFAEGYRNGAQCTNPAVNVLTTYTGTFVDMEVGANTAQDMIGQGADVIFGAAGLTGNGAILYSAQNDRWAIGVDTDQYLNVFGNGTVSGSNKLLSSAMKRVDNAVYQTIEDYVGGNFTSGAVLYDLSTNGVGLAPFHEAEDSISQDVKDNIEIVKQGIIDGTINIDDPCEPPPPPMPHIEAFAWFDRYSLVDWPAGMEVDVTIQNPDYHTTFTPDGSSTWYDFFPGVDLQPGSIITATNGETSKVLEISPLSATVDADAGTVTGVAMPESSLHMWTDGDHFQLPIEQDISSDSTGNWSVTIIDYTPWVWFTRGQMWEGDNDGDVTYAIWHVQQPVVEVWLAQNEVRAFGWPRDTELTFYINDVELGKAFTQPAPWFEGTGAVLNAGDFGVQLEPGMDIKVEYGDTWKSTVVQDIKITYASPGDDKVYGYAPPNAYLELGEWEDSPVLRFFNNGADQSWMIDYSEPSLNGVTVDLNPGDELRLFMREEDMDSTVWQINVPNPFIAVSLTQNWFWGNSFTPETPLTFSIYKNQGDETPILQFTRTADTYGNVNIEGWEYPWQPEPGNYMVVTDGVNTKELLLEYITLDLFDFDNEVISGLASSPGRWVDVGVGNADGEQWLGVEADDSGRWTADFKTIGFDVTEDMWAGGHVSDDDGDVTVAHNSGPSGPPEYLLHDIYIFDPVSGKVTRLTQLDLMGEFNPSWSPNGKEIAHDVVLRDGSQSIYITNVKTGISVLLLGAENGGNDAVWSPSGKWIVFDKGAWSDTPNLYMVPAGGGTPRLVRNDAVSADYAPSGKRLVFQQPSDGSIRTIAVDGGKGGETTIAGSGTNPSWSPDGNWIAYENGGDIWKVQVNALGRTLGDPIQMTSGTFGDDQPTWSPDSKTIVYHSGFNTDWDLWSVPAAGGTSAWLNGAPDYGDYDPAFARNAPLIAYSGASPDGQVARTWVAAFTYNAGTWSSGTHTYQFWSQGNPTGDEFSFTARDDVPLYPGFALIRPRTLRAQTMDGCSNVEAIYPDQQTLFFIGWTFDGGYADAKAYFASLNAQVRWDAESPENMTQHEIFPLTSGVDWFGYMCTFIAP